MNNSDIIDALFSLADPEYHDFQCKLMPTVPPEKVIGVRMPALRKFAKEFLKSGQTNDFLESLPHEYYEENNLHGLLICETKDYNRLTMLLDEFLPYVDNWATCDLIAPKLFKKHPPELPEKIESWLNSGKTYTVRFALEMLMNYYLDDEFDIRYCELASAVKSDEYYVKMMVAWYFATALAKQYDRVLPYLTENRLEKWTHNKTIQKAIESYRITDEQKRFLRTIKRS